jgi:hypothetical protein
MALIQSRWAGQEGVENVHVVYRKGKRPCRKPTFRLNNDMIGF